MTSLCGWRAAGDAAATDELEAHGRDEMARRRHKKRSRHRRGQSAVKREHGRGGYGLGASQESGRRRFRSYA